MNEHHFPANTVIFQPGDPGDRAYLVREGTVELLRGPADRPTRLVLVSPGEVFGEMSLIEERPHVLTARAVGVVRASTLTRAEFEGLLTTDPAACRHYLKSLFERLRAMSAAEAPGAELVPVAEIVTVTIHPLTRRAGETVPENGLPVPKFPFRIGRAAEANEPESLDLNDLWLLDRMPFTVSRNHALLDLEGGRVILRDRGSKLGLHVNDVHVGGRAFRRQVSLVDGDNVVIIGDRTSPYRFRVQVARAGQNAD